jgi:YD repeat-containing protein
MTCLLGMLLWALLLWPTLLQGGVPVPVEDYAYDGEGNRTASHLSTTHLANEHNQLQEDDSYYYSYDARGNRVVRQSKETGEEELYTYDRQNRLIGYTSPTTEATYAYDALDRRIAKTVDGVTEAYVYDSADLGDSTASNTALTFRAGALIKRWLFGPQVEVDGVAKPTTSWLRDSERPQPSH